jgi:hypothetical protein
MRSRGDLLLSGPFVVSLLVLVLNDHVLKQAWPGIVTGKLSDVAGVAMMATLVTALTGRSTIGFCTTAIGFVALKTVPVVSVLAAPVLGGTTRTDPTDLIALVVLVPLWRWARGCSTGRLGADSAWLLPLQIVAISAAVFATTATSCGAEGVLEVVAVDGVVYATTVNDVYESTDGGDTWVKSTLDSWDERLQRRYPDTLADCIGPEICFQIVRPGAERSELVVSEVRAKVDRPILTVTAEQRQALIQVVQPQCGDFTFDSIAGVEIDNGVHVLLSMGDAGVLHRGPDQSWEWVAVGEYGLRVDDLGEASFGLPARSTIPDDPWAGWPAGVATVFLVLAPVALLLAIIPITRLAKRHRRNPALGVIACVVVAIGLGLSGFVVWAITEGFDNPGGRAVAAAWIAAAAIATAVPFIVWHARPRRPANWRPPDPTRRVG